MSDQTGALAAIGDTPLVKLKYASELTGCTILGKAEDAEDIKHDHHPVLDIAGGETIGEKPI